VDFLSLLLLMPFWVSELVRVYGWMILLRESGVVNHFLLKAGLMQRPVEMLYNDITMVMGLVYTSMLFMVVPLISVLESLDDSLIEAAYDLGGNVAFPSSRGLSSPMPCRASCPGASWCSCSPWATT
jgi:spermidine/putrescine transport system permease protein